MNRATKTVMIALLPVAAIAAGLLILRQRNKVVPIPQTDWPLFNAPHAEPLTGEAASQLEGVYEVIGDTAHFGRQVALRWSYSGPENGRRYRLSGFFEREGGYFICEGRRLDSTLLFKGYWRQVEGITGATGPIHLQLPAAALNDAALVLNGQVGRDETSTPGQPIRLQRKRSLFSGAELEIVAHRGGGRSGDYVPSSENTIELIRQAALFGASGVEIDVQLTSDGVPVVFHDGWLTARTVDGWFKGSLSKHTYAELAAIPLKKGEVIPTLEAALTAIVEETPLRFVWLDAKEAKILEKLRALQERFLRSSAAAGRKLEIVIGIPDEQVYEAVRQWPDHRQVPTVCELGTEEAAAINARIWAPMWTKGLQEEELAQVRRQGRRAFVWTIDKERQIREFLYGGGYDGIVTNFPARVAYFHYTRQ